MTMTQQIFLITYSVPSTGSSALAKQRQIDMSPPWGCSQVSAGEKHKHNEQNGAGN